ncbi:MAG: cysteine hydrolase [Chloroflexi bacterium]|nr:cysteine hydrolase [Chloroflexota bacterium]
MDISSIIDPKNTALLVIDMQNGFCHPEGSLARGGSPYLHAWQIVPTVKQLVNVCRQNGVHVIWSLQKHFPDDITRKKHRIPSHLDRAGAIPCLNGTWDAELVDELKLEVMPQDDLVEKHRSSCFHNTTLEVKLRMRGISTLIVSGVTTNYCVESTIRDAYALDYDIVVVQDCVACPWEDLQKATLKNVEIFFGQVVPLAGVQGLVVARQ